MTLTVLKKGGCIAASLAAGCSLLLSCSSAWAQNAPAALSKSGPSFDCRKAATALEKDICTQTNLASLDLKIAQHYSVLKRNLDAPGRKAIHEDQRWFLGARDRAYEAVEPSERRQGLGERMKSRLEFLQAVQLEPGSDLVGVWKNVAGEIKISPEKNGTLRVRMNAVEPINGRWVCDMDGSAKSQGSSIAITESTIPDWQIDLVRKGSVLEVSEVPLKGERLSSPFCGMNGSFNGAYFKVEAR